jgi:sugar/nucleoside kinase (ribokinase family)
MTNPVILSVGHVTHDRYGNRLVPGGSVYYGARAQHALGARVRVVTVVGDDFACDEAWDDLEVNVRRSGKTTLFTNDYSASGIRVQRLEAQAPEVSPAQLPDDWRDADLLHLAPVIGEVRLESWLGAIRARVTGIGVQGWIRKAGANETVVQTPWDVDASLLGRIDVACVGEEDLRDQGDLLDRLCRSIAIVAFTHGKRGCDLIVHGKTTKIGIYDGAHEVDPTGAGDVFAAGLMLGIARGMTAVDAARLGAAAASIVVEGEAGTALPRIAGEATTRAASIASTSSPL